MSAHVVPKAPAFSTVDEDEKTTIESGWEEEASTTVEQGDVGDKIRALGLGREPPRRSATNITSTDGNSMSDEPTVDDQRGAAALAMLPPPIIARLVITQGNDSGQMIEVRPGKTYTIGRGIDNDLVLSDIAVSRKHFDVRHENGSWVLADRGSGNGTLINQQIEDAPFMLASGDVIEIGNTAFRFDLPNGVPRVQSSYDVSVDDDLELSTMSGKPLRESAPPTPHKHMAPVKSPGMPPMRSPGVVPPIVPVAAGPVTQSRPKTLPPPAPLSLPRPRTQSSRPPVGYALDRPGPHSHSLPLPQPLPPPSLAAAVAPTMLPMHGLQALQPQPQPQTTLPLPQMANRPPLPPAALIDAPLSSLPTTIPGQGLPLAAGHPPRLAFSYPSAAELPHQYAPNGSRGQMVVVASGQPGRDSTSLVPPMSYPSGQPVMVPQQTYSPSPQLSRRMKMVLGGAALALIAAIATIAIIKGSNGTPPPIDHPANAPTKPVTPPRPVVEPIRDPKTVKAVVPPRTTTNPTTTPVTPKSDKITTTTSPTATSTPPPTAPVTPKSDKIAATSPTTPPTTVIPPPTAPVTPPTAPVIPRTDKIAAIPPTTTANPPTTAHPPTAPVIPKTDKTNKVEVIADKTNKVEVLPPTNKTDKRGPKRTDKRTDKKATPPRTDVARIDPDKTNPDKTNPDKTNKVESAATPKTDKKRGGRSTQDVKNDADGMYRAKRFGDAAALVTAALPSFSGGDSQELKSIAAIYSQLGKAYNVGMAPGTKATDAFVALRRAISYDRDVGSSYVAEIEHVLVTVASKAALSFAAAKEYESAFQAVRISESLGSTSPTNKSVRDKLEEIAGELYRSASSELTTDPDGAKKKLRQILGMVDAKNALHVKATKLLNGS